MRDRVIVDRVIDADVRSVEAASAALLNNRDAMGASRCGDDHRVAEDRNVLRILYLNLSAPDPGAALRPVVLHDVVADGSRIADLVRDAAGNVVRDGIAIDHGIDIVPVEPDAEAFVIVRVIVADLNSVSCGELERSTF